MRLPVPICATLRIIAAFGMLVGTSRRLLDELHHAGIPVEIRLVMVHFLPVYGSRLRALVDLQGADNRLDGDDTAHPVLHPFRGPETRTASLVPDAAPAELRAETSA